MPTLRVHPVRPERAKAPPFASRVSQSRVGGSISFLVRRNTSKALEVSVDEIMGCLPWARTSEGIAAWLRQTVCPYVRLHEGHHYSVRGIGSHSIGSPDVEWGWRCVVHEVRAWEWAWVRAVNAVRRGRRRVSHLWHPAPGDDTLPRG